MKIATDGFKLTIDLSDLVEALGKDDHVKLARLVAADKELFAAVLECVTSDSRFGRYFEDAEEGEWWFNPESLLELREKLLPLMPEIARGAVQEALQQRNQARLSEEGWKRWAWALYHAWPDAHWSSRPSGPERYQPAKAADAAEVDALLGGGQ